MKRKINPIVYLFQWKRFNTSFMCKRICKKSNTSKMYRKLILFYTCKQNDSLPPSPPPNKRKGSGRAQLQPCAPGAGACSRGCWNKANHRELLGQGGCRAQNRLFSQAEQMIISGMMLSPECPWGRTSCSHLSAHLCRALFSPGGRKLIRWS